MIVISFCSACSILSDFMMSLIRKVFYNYAEILSIMQDALLALGRNIYTADVHALVFNSIISAASTFKIGLSL